jgi:colicin import membrane protein
MSTLRSHPQFDFSPQEENRQGLSFALAFLAHLLLLAALTWGISWNQEAILESSTAELWSSAPNLTAPEPEPVQPKEEPKAVAPAKTPPPPASKVNPNTLKEAQLAVEKLKKKEEEKKEKEQLAKLELEKQRLKEQEKKKLKELELEKAKKAAEEEKLKQAKEREKAKKEPPKIDPKELAKQQAKEAKEMEQRRMEDLNRVQKSLSNPSSATGVGQNAGTASASNLSLGSGSGNAMSANYAGKIVELIKKNMGVRKEFSGNPSAEVQVNCAPDGTITTSQLIKKSGNAEWDEVVLTAIERTRVTSKIPKDIDGRVPPSMLIVIKP